MQRFMRRLGSLSFVVMAAGLCVGVAPAPAFARQMVFAAPGGPGGSAQTPPVSSAELNRYADLLGMNAEQKEAAKSLLDGMQAEFESSSEKMRNDMTALREEAQEDGDMTVFREKIPAIMGKMRESRTKLEKTFFEDLKATLSDEQSAKWPALERMRRRDQGLSRGRLAGESMDLTRIVDDLKLQDEAKQSVKPLLEQYETDLDRELSERMKASEKFSFNGPGGPAGAELRAKSNNDEFRKTMEDIREASKRVRDVNQRYARQILGALPAENAEQFEKRVKRESFPQVFRESYAQKALKAAGEFGDLSAEQKKTLADLASQYEREAESINNKWSAAILENESNDNSATVMTPGGAGTFITMRDGEAVEGKKDPTADQREARKKLDDRTLENLKSTLNEDQQTRLPEKRRQREGGELSAAGGFAGEAVFVQASTISDGQNQQTTVQAVSVGDAPAAGEGGEQIDVMVVSPATAPPAPAPAEAKPVEKKNPV